MRPRREATMQRFLSVFAVSFGADVIRLLEPQCALIM
jgi:hypothetical protein